MKQYVGVRVDVATWVSGVCILNLNLQAKQ